MQIAMWNDMLGTSFLVLEVFNGFNLQAFKYLCRFLTWFLKFS